MGVTSSVPEGPSTAWEDLSTVGKVAIVTLGCFLTLLAGFVLIVCCNAAIPDSDQSRRREVARPRNFWRIRFGASNNSQSRITSSVTNNDETSGPYTSEQGILAQGRAHQNLSNVAPTNTIRVTDHASSSAETRSNSFGRDPGGVGTVTRPSPAYASLQSEEEDMGRRIDALPKVHASRKNKEMCTICLDPL